MVQLTHVSFDGFEARATVEAQGQRQEVFIRTSIAVPQPRAWGDVWAPFGMFPGMRLAESVRFNVALSWRRRKNLARAQDVLTSRFPRDFTRTKLVAPPARPMRHAPTGRVAQFFTGGIDSFYTMLTNPQVNVLVYAYDLVNEPTKITELLRGHLREIADHYGKELIEIEYNARVSLDNFADWGQQSYTGVLSSFAALISRYVDGVVIPSQYAGTENDFWGDHPDINDLWAPGSISYRYDAGDVPRFDKTALVATDEFARDRVRVCWRATDQLNCGVCEKCIRTRTAFEIIESGYTAPAFPQPLRVNEVEELVFPHVFVNDLWRENLEAARRAGRDDLVRAIQQAFLNSTSS